VGSRHGLDSNAGFLFFFFGCVLRIPVVLFGVVLGFAAACCAVERESAVCDCVEERVLRVDTIFED
jgi:hypothetical protein